MTNDSNQESYSQIIKLIFERRNWKAKRLNWSGEALVGAAFLSALDILWATVLK